MAIQARRSYVLLVVASLFGLLPFPAKSARGNRQLYFNSYLHPMSSEETAKLSLTCTLPWIPPLNPTYSDLTPTIINDPQDVVVFKDHGEVFFNCSTLNALHQPSWFFKEDRPGADWISFQSSNSEARQFRTSLVFDAKTTITTASVGFYRCYANGGVLGSVYSRAARLSLGTIDADYHFVGENRREYVLAGSSLSIPCGIKASPWSAVNVEWEKNTKPLGLLHGDIIQSKHNESGYVLLSNGTLLVTNVPISLNLASFRCRVSSPTGKIHFYSDVQVNVAQHPDSFGQKQPISVRLQTSNPTPSPGEQVILACISANFTSSWLLGSPTVQWFFDDKPLERFSLDGVSVIGCKAFPSPVSTFQVDGGLLLVVCNFGRQNVGRYTCQIDADSESNDVDNGDAVHVKEKSVASVTLTLKEPPQRLKSSSVALLTLYPGEQRLVDCQSYIMASSPAFVQWLYKGTVVKQASGSVKNAWNLSINSSAIGMFQCIVNNTWGSVQVSFRVRVKSVPGRVKFDSQCSQRDNYLCWDEPNNHSCAITHYVVGVSIGKSYPPVFKFNRLSVGSEEGGGGILEACVGKYYKSYGCNYLIAACNRIGCGQPMCSPVKPPPSSHESLGFEDSEVKTTSPYTVSFSATAVTKGFADQVVFCVRKMASSLSFESNKSNLNPVSTKVKIDITGLESCTQYEACSFLRLIPTYLNVNLIPGNVRGLSCGTNTSFWSPFTTQRSPAPEKAPQILHVYRISPTSAIVFYEVYPWCQMYPNSVLDFYSTSTFQPVCIANQTANLTVPTVHAYVHQNLAKDRTYTVHVRSCSSLKNCSDVLGMRSSCSDHRQNAGVQIPASLTWPTTLRGDLIQPQGGIGRPKLTVEWQSNMDSRVSVSSSFLRVECHDQQANLSRIAKEVSLKKGALMFLINAERCTVWVSATFVQGGVARMSRNLTVQLESSISTGTTNSPTVSTTSMVTEKSKSSSSSKLNFGSLYIYIGSAVAGLLAIIIAVSCFVSYRRSHRRSRNIAEDEGPIYEDLDAVLGSSTFKATKHCF